MKTAVLGSHQSERATAAVSIHACHYPQSLPVDVRYGSLADICHRSRNVRYVPVTDIQAVVRHDRLGVLFLRPLKNLANGRELATRAAGRHRSSTTQKPFDNPSLFRRGGRRHAR